LARADDGDGRSAVEGVPIAPHVENRRVIVDFAQAFRITAIGGRENDNTTVSASVDNLLGEILGMSLCGV
jgi:hypothetical protein